MALQYNFPNEWPYNAAWFPKNEFQFIWFSIKVVVITFIAVLILYLIIPAASDVPVLLHLALVAIILGLVAVFAEQYRVKPPQTLPALPLQPIRQRLDAYIWKAIADNHTAIPPNHIRELMLKTGEEIYRSVVIPPLPAGDTPEAVAQRAQWEGAPEKLLNAIAESMTAYLKALPVFEPAPFQIPLAEYADISWVIYNMSAPFSALPFNVPLRDVMHQHAVRMTGILNFKGPGLAYAQHHPGPAVQTMTDYAGGTPFYNLLNIQVPFSPYQDEDRFAHQWVMGEQGLGKTVLLSNQINADLDRVAKGECALFILDPKNKELGHYLPRLKRFGPGGDLYGKLVYLEADDDYPLALNIFDFQQSDFREVEQMTLTFMAGFAEMSQQMQNVLKYALQALEKIPGATIFTFHELLYKDRTSSGFERLAAQYPELHKLDKDTVRFLSVGMHQGSYGPSLGAMKARLDGFTADPMFKKMFSFSHSLINMAKELAEPKVVIVNASRATLQSATEPFGRYFISRLLQTSYTRRAGEARALPLFCYIDECHDFVAHDASITQLLAQARDQNVSLCLAHQGLFQVQEIRGALELCAIKCRAVSKGVWDYAVRDNHRTLHVPFIDFSKMPQMTRAEFEAIRTDMRTKYAAQSVQKRGGFDPHKDAE